MEPQSLLAIRRIGDRVVPAIGMGAMTLTQVEGYDVERGIRTVHAALDAGVRLFDTADSYGPVDGRGENEDLLVRALSTWSGSADELLVATKGGHLHHDGTWWLDGSRAHLHEACRASLQRLHPLGLEAIPLYQHHRPDPKVDYAESLGALRELHDDGLVQRVGISNANVDRIRQAYTVLGDALVSVQNEHSPAHRDVDAELRVCEELGLTFLAYSPLGGMRSAKQLGTGGDEAAAFAWVARAHGVSPQRVALAWALRRSPNLIPIPGASRPESIRDSAAALSLELGEDDLALLDVRPEEQSDHDRRTR